MQDKSEGKLYRNFETPDEDLKAYYRSLTPEERINIALELRGDPKDHPKMDRSAMRILRNFETSD
ncbi:MAG: hypothetical protein JNK63_01110 [Chthonomonas sp.]|nr:hypothetical protein [Chthonomonas sp.]